MATAEDIARYRENYQDEIDGAAMYRALSDMESDPALKELYEKLAATEERHAAFWREKLAAAGVELGEPEPSRRAKILIWLAKRLGTNVLVTTMAAEEKAGQFMYDDQPETEGTSLPADERSHARILAQLADEGPKTITGPVLARIEGRHSAVGGNALRAAVLGANDGLVSNMSLVMGVAGATDANSSIVIAGVAGLLAGAISMALGEWISVQSSRELYERQIEIERREIREIPEEEAEELALIYESKGMPPDQAAELAARVMQDEEKALDTMAREELGIDPDELGGSPWEAAIASFFLFAAGAILPVFPFLVSSGAPAIWGAIVLGGLGLFGLGAAISLMTGRNVWFSGFRQMGFGLAAAAVTFGIGTLLGVAVS